MDIDRFKQLVSRLEAESAATPRAYRLRVAALAALGFVILALLLGSLAFGLVALAGIGLAMLLTGGTALILLLKFGKLLFLLAVPMWYLGKSATRALFIRLPAPEGREIMQADAPPLFAALQRMREQMGGPRFHHVLVVDDLQAAVVQRPAFGLVGWPRNYLLLGLPLLESMPPEEALAVVAHEYGHLAAAHGRFSAYVYRLRHTWGTVHGFVEAIQGWPRRVVGPLVRWYAPYFNAYTFVLARADEFHADAASARLVGPEHFSAALKRVNTLRPRREGFLSRAYDSVLHQAAPPTDLALRWSEEAARPAPEADGERWLGMALDRVGHPTDSHPTLRARLMAQGAAADVTAVPPPMTGPSAAQAWLPQVLPALREAFQARWAEEVAERWTARHAQAQEQRVRLAELQDLAEPSVDETIERFRLQLELEPGIDLRQPLAAFNDRHPDHAVGLLIEAGARLDHGDASGLALIDRAGEIEPQAIKPGCERAHRFLVDTRDPERAEAYAERWRARDAFEARRDAQLREPAAGDRLMPHDLPADALAALKATLAGPAGQDVAQAWLARREITADPSALQCVLGVRLGWWARRRGRQGAVLQRLAAVEWPVAMVFVMLEGRFSKWRKPLRALAGSRVV
jgi:Zn-dependent protease with chaperone function